MKKQTEDIFEPAIPDVPHGWDVLPFEQAVDVISDKSKRVKQSAYLPSGKLPVIDQGQDFIGGYTDDEDLAFEGELPVILFGDHTRSIKYVDRPFAVGAEGVKILKPSGGFDPKFLYYLLRSLQIPSRGYSRHFQFLRKFHFPRAPEGQQKRIVAEIEKQFSRLDEAVANLKRVKANLKRYKAAVLKAAVEGRLVETEAEVARRAAQGSANVAGGRMLGATEGRNYETGEQLLQRILETRRSQWKGKGKYKEPAAADTTDLPELPEGWAWATVEQLNLSNRPCAYGVLQPGDDLADGIPFVRVGDINDGRVDLTALKRISPKIAAQYPRTKLVGGEFLITLVGAIGRTALVSETLKGANVARAVGVVPLTEAIDAQWVEIWFRNPAKVLEMTSKSHEVARKTLNLEDVRAASVAIPPYVEQHRIVAEVDFRLSLVRELEAQVDANHKRAERLRQSVLQRVFSGGLAIADIPD